MIGMATDTDWEGVERDYRAGLLSAREIGACYGVSHTAIQKRAKREGWERDLQAKVLAKAEAKVAKAAVSKEVAMATKATEAAIVEANAEAIARVRLSHRTDINKARTLAMALLSELEHQTGNQEQYADLFELLSDPGEDGGSEAAKERQRRRLEAFQRAMSLGNRTKTMKDLADTLKTLVTLERDAYGLASAKPEDEAPAGRPVEPSNKMAREIAYALHLGLKAANDSQPKPGANAA